MVVVANGSVWFVGVGGGGGGGGRGGRAKSIKTRWNPQRRYKSPFHLGALAGIRVTSDNRDEVLLSPVLDFSAGGIWSTAGPSNHRICRDDLSGTR